MPRSNKSAEIIKAQAETIEDLTRQLIEANAEVERLKRLMPAPRVKTLPAREVDPRRAQYREYLARCKTVAAERKAAVRVLGFDQWLPKRVAQEQAAAQG